MTRPPDESGPEQAKTQSTSPQINKVKEEPPSAPTPEAQPASNTVEAPQDEATELVTHSREANERKPSQGMTNQLSNIESETVDATRARSMDARTHGSLQDHSAADVDQTTPTTEVAKPESATKDSRWRLHKPDPAQYFPPHLRREFLLSDGSRTILSSRNQTASYNDAIFYSVRDGKVTQTHVVKELLGLEKSPALQDPALRDSKKAAAQD